MYLAIVVLLMGILPIVSIFIEFVVLHGSADLAFLVGKWFVFWSVGVRLLLAGLRQIATPGFTAETIFALKDRAALPIVRELGFANLSIGLLGALALLKNDWIVPAELVGGLFYGLAGIQHLLKSDRNVAGTVAMASDLFIFVVFAGDLAAVVLHRA
jgi:hypothetical protein